jgi:hypothetical protein
MNLNEPWRFLGQRGGELGLGYGRITSLKTSQFQDYLSDPGVHQEPVLRH